MPKLRNTPPTKERKELFIKEYMRSYGILTTALSACQITYNTYKKWFMEDDKFRDECINVERVQGDLVENKLLDLIVQGNITAIIFYLKCRRHEKWNDRNTLQIQGTIEHKQLLINVIDNETKLLMDNAVKLIDMEGNEI